MSIREQARTVVIDHRYEGLPEVAHGGYLAGLLAGALGAEGVEVKLRRPVTTSRRLSLERCDAGGAELRDGETVLAVAKPATPEIAVPPAVSLAEAELAAARFLGRDAHPVPGCVVCGTERAAGDGLHVFPGPVAGRRLVAAPWVPPAEGTTELGSAALDCAQLWALIAHAPAGTKERGVTAELRLRRRHPLRPGRPHVVIGWPLELGSRSWLAGAAVIGPGGEVCLAGIQRAALTSWGVPLGRPHRNDSDSRPHMGEHDNAQDQGERR